MSNPDYMKEAYDLLVTKLKDERDQAFKEVDWYSDRNSFRERAYADFIYKRFGKRGLLAACHKVDAADAEYAGKETNNGAYEWADAEYADNGYDILVDLKEILKDAELAGEKTATKDIDFHLEMIRNMTRTLIKRVTGDNT